MSALDIEFKSSAKGLQPQLIKGWTVTEDLFDSPQPCNLKISTLYLREDKTSSVLPEFIPTP